MSRRGGWRVVDARFEQSAARLDQCPTPDIPEVAIAGRSNVGKSSLLNALTRRKGLARVSRTPGRTQLLNFFELTLQGAGGRRRLRCVDLPGYGFAKAHHSIRASFAPMIEGYLSGREALRGLVMLIDLRRGLMDLDEQMMAFASARELPILLVGTKADKLGAASLGVARRSLAKSVGVRPSDVLVTSARDDEGLQGPDSLAADLAELCGDGGGDEGAEPGEAGGGPDEPEEAP